ncbi:MAG TPA: carboxypeptidase-like regulatory domain-containing protein [Edaphobacter sp.]|nr:carboxypeptidase-like regulatory domain-containing protein [Edaphobacter sp.]
MVRKVYLLWMFIAFGTSFGFAQTAQVSGFISDPGGQNVVGAKVTMTDQATQVELNAITNSSGLYAFTLPASRYRITSVLTNETSPRLCLQSWRRTLPTGFSVVRL